MKVVPVTVRVLVSVSGIPSLNSCTSTVSKVRSDSLKAGLNSTVQLKVTAVPSITGLATLLVIETVAGPGTERKK